MKITRVKAPIMAEIDTAKNEIFVGSLYFDAPRASQRFIMFHEVGHKRHQSEEKADLYAMGQMKRKGYSAKQCVKILEDNLVESPSKRARIENLINHGY